MLPVEDGKFAALQQMAMRWPNRLKQAAAVCNSLSLINKTQVVGDAADKQAFKAVEARFLVCLWTSCSCRTLQVLVSCKGEHNCFPGGQAVQLPHKTSTHEAIVLTKFAIVCLLLAHSALRHA